MGLRRWWSSRRVMWQTSWQTDKMAKKQRRADCLRDTVDGASTDDDPDVTFTERHAVARLQFAPSDAHVITLLVAEDQRRLVIPRDTIIDVIRDNVWANVGDVSFGRCRCVGRDHIMFNIRYPNDNDRVTWLSVSVDALHHFVSESLRKVPQGQELRDVDLDAELQKLLTAGGEPGAG